MNVCDPPAVYKRLVDRTATLLRPLGYRKAHSAFARELSDTWQVLQFQKSVYSTRDSITFTINLGVYVKRLRQERDGRRVHRPPAELDCHVRTRLGELLDHPDDKWWIVDRETREERLTSEILSLIEERALPFLDEYASENRIREEWLAGRSQGLTKVERLEYLVRLLHATGPRDLLPEVLARLWQVKPGMASILEEELGISASRRGDEV